MAHQTNLEVQSLSSMLMVSKLEDLFQSLYKYLSSHLEFTKLARIMELEGLKVVRNIKTRWISMLAPFIKVGKEYKTLIAKMAG
jgi:hypothetical protein